MEYRFRFKHKWFWHSRKVIGHHFDESQNKMILYFANGGLEEIASWKSCSAKLGSDWALTVKKNMEQQAGVPIAVNLKG
jgi:hypothetical protein